MYSYSDSLFAVTDEIYVFRLHSGDICTCIHTKNKNTIKMVNISALICTYYNYELRGYMMMAYDGVLYYTTVIPPARSMMYKCIHMLRNWSEQYPCIYLSRRIRYYVYVRTYYESVSPYTYVCTLRPVPYLL